MSTFTAAFAAAFVAGSMMLSGSSVGLAEAADASSIRDIRTISRRAGNMRHGAVPAAVPAVAKVMEQLSDAYSAGGDEVVGFAEQGQEYARQLWNQPIPSPSVGLTLTLVPPVGAITPIMGAAYALNNPTNFKACILIGNNFTNPGILNFYGPKPGVGSCFPLSQVGDFVASNWASDFHDWVSPEFAVFILPNSVNPPDHSQGTTDLANWYQSAVAWTFARRPAVIGHHLTVPRRGDLGPVAGCFTNLPMSPNSYRVALYVRAVDGRIYGSKPWSGHLYSLNSTGCFVADSWFSHPNDANIPFIQVVLLPAGLNPPNMNGQTSFDAWWIGKFVKFIQKLRPAGPPSGTPTPSQTPSNSPSNPPSPSLSPSVSGSVSPTKSVTPSVTPSASFSSSILPSRSVTPTVSYSSTVTPTAAPTGSNSVAPTPGPSIVVFLPPIGSGGPITGYGVNIPGGCRNWKILVYVQSNNTEPSTGSPLVQWWGPKPAYPNSNSHRQLWGNTDSGAGNWWFPFNDDCTFSITNWASDAMDLTVPVIGVFVVPRGIPNIPQFNGQTSLHEHLLNWVIASSIQTRPTTASFAAIDVPRIGKIDPITGTVINLPEPDINLFRALVFVYSPNGGWWGPKPVANFAYTLQHIPHVYDAGDLYMPNWASAPQDRFTPVVRIILVREEFISSGRLQSLNVNGSPTLPSLLLSATVAYVEVVRAPQSP